jgi:hypothetical protein
MQPYFAYGSNLDVTQMTRRCPDASDPRPAALADHDWLINERGVATVEPLDGARVHGVLWQVSDHDLTVLDSAEGVPVRYRRDRMTVETDDGPAEAWVYVDPRVEPGAPRPGYLERIIGGATHHGLPTRWVEYLHRWDPVNWPRQLPPTDLPAPQTLSDLLADPEVVESSAPVGSSAKTMSAPVTCARAIATRWACPPDSSPILRSSMPESPSADNQEAA